MLLIMEVLQMINNNKYRYLVKRLNCLKFYYNGVLILEINITKDESLKDKLLSLSIDEYEQ